MFEKSSSLGYRALLAGIRMKTLSYGEKTLLAEFLLDGASTLPRHSHPYEQTGYLVKGHIVLSIGEAEHDVTPGDAWCIATGVEHGARVVEDSVIVEVFSPVREDYLPKDR
jgi:quercetin dioxygenase-like cupin family protein